MTNARSNPRAQHASAVHTDRFQNRFLTSHAGVP
jgi:hypothetical protein